MAAMATLLTVTGHQAPTLLDKQRKKIDIMKFTYKRNLFKASFFFGRQAIAAAFITKPPLKYFSGN